jgi:hypothetical protein
MTKSRKVPIVEKKKRANETAHWRTMADPGVRRLVGNLQSGWKSMGPLERGRLLCELAALGCSTRGLEKELGQSTTSIRRHIVLATLPEADRKAIESGASSKKILAQKAIADRHRRWQTRLDEDRKTGALSDKIATDILAFCRAGKQLRKNPILTGDVPILLNTVEWHLSQFATSGNRAVRVSKKLELNAQFRKMRPPKAKDAFWMEYQGKWLANFVWASAPEGPIRDRALQKAAARAGELAPTRTPIEMYKDRARRLAEISTPPPWRKADKKAWSLQRQGSLTPTTKRP